MPPVRLQQALALGLGVWAVGVQVHELLATVGAWGTVLAALLSVGAVKPFATPEQRLAAVRRWWPLAGLLAWALVVPWAFGGHSPKPSSVARLFDWLLVPAAAFAVASVSDRALPRIGLGAGLVLLISCAVAATQHFGVWPRSSAFAHWAWLRLPFERMDETVPGRTDRFMAGGLLLHRLKFANVSAAAVVLFTCASVARSAYRRVFWGVLAFALPAVVVLPHARAAAVAMVAACAVAVFFSAPNRRVAWLASAGVATAALAVVLVVPSARERFVDGFTSEGTNEREIIVKSGLTAVRLHPLAGEGLGYFRPALYAPPDAPTAVLEHQGKAHNQFVSLAAEAGVPATLFLVVMLGGWGVLAWRNRHAYGVPLLSTLTLLVLLCLLHDPLFHAESSMALMFAVGVSLGVIARAKKEPPVWSRLEYFNTAPVRAAP